MLVTIDWNALVASSAVASNGFTPDRSRNRRKSATDTPNAFARVATRYNSDRFAMSSAPSVTSKVVNAARSRDVIASDARIVGMWVEMRAFPGLPLTIASSPPASAKSGSTGRSTTGFWNTRS